MEARFKESKLQSIIPFNRGNPESSNEEFANASLSKTNDQTQRDKDEVLNYSEPVVSCNKETAVKDQLKSILRSSNDQ